MAAFLQDTYSAELLTSMQVLCNQQFYLAYQAAVSTGILHESQGAYIPC